MKSASRVLLAGAVFAAACTPGWSGSSTAPVPASRPAVPSVSSAPAGSFRIVETFTGRNVSFDAMASRAALADVVFFGEMHDDPETHYLEFALLEALGQRREHVVLSLEMFERDVQPN